ncbi:MAG: response regulator [Holophaga sp.]|nr:response regulator [Holophaga sp.]
MIRVLLVEDDPMVAELNRHYVNRVEGFEIAASVENAQQAKQVLRERKVDLILLDISMAGQSGVDLLAEIRSQALEVDVIFVTAARDTRTVSTALKLGAVDYLIKPFEFERLKQALEAYRETHRRMSMDDPVSQTELDLVMGRRGSGSRADQALPKGLDRITLERVCKVIFEWPKETPWFTCDEIAEPIGISRVSVRKYCEFLCGLKVLKMENAYGSVGRPIHRFTVQKAYVDEVWQFLNGE